MSLAHYHAKRDFAHTPEPRGEPKQPGQTLAFVVQEHQASRHHFDFRLELDGVLKSWAVPKGPSMNPHERHLAIQTEDHPFAYRKFEGTIPEGNYGAGQVIIWDQGTYEPRADTNDPEATLKKELKAGHLTFVLHGKKLRGEFALIKLKNAKENDAWLLIKKGDSEATTTDITKKDQSVVSGKTINQQKPHTGVYPKAPMPHTITPMLCTLVEKPFDGTDWLFELKWDGYRAIAAKHKSSLELYSRNGLDFAKKYPEIAEAVRALKDDVVLDGEIVAVDQEGRPHFEWLQNWHQNKEGVLGYFVFDILWHNDHNVQTMPLVERKKLLTSIIPKRSLLQVSDHVLNYGTKLFAAAEKRGLEGIVAKRSASPYQPGVRGNAWLKIKTHLRQETVICGFTEPRGSRKYIGSLILGVYKGDTLLYVGHSGGGIPTDQLQELHTTLTKLEQDHSPFTHPPKLDGTPIHWVKPKLLCEVTLSEWTKEGIMRQPVFKGMRSDKDPHKVKKETPAAPHRSDGHVTLPGTKVAVSHLDKIFWPKHGYTKGDLMAYYQSVAEYILPYLKDRAQSLLRQPHGIEGEKFFQKDMKFKLPPYAKSETVYSESTKENVHFLVCNNLDTLLYMVQLGCIEINPWSSRTHKPDNPDWAVIDLDPEGVEFTDVIKVAQTVHQVCEDWDIVAYPKTSGKTGIHIFIPLGAKYDYDQTRQFAQLIAIEVNKRLPDITSIERSPEKRPHRVYLDFLQNGKGQTLAAPYAVRPTPDASVSMPLEWSEVTPKLRPTDFTIQNALARLQKKGDLWEPVIGKGVDIHKVLKKMEEHH